MSSSGRRSSSSTKSAYLLETIRVTNIRENSKLFEDCSRVEMWDPISRCFVVQYLKPKEGPRPPLTRRATSKRGQPDSYKDAGLDEEDMEFMRNQFGLLSGGVTSVMSLKSPYPRTPAPSPGPRTPLVTHEAPNGKAAGGRKQSSFQYSMAEYKAFVREEIADLTDLKDGINGKRKGTLVSIDSKRIKRS